MDMKFVIKGFHFDDSYDEISHPSSVDMLYSLKEDGDGVLDKVHAARDKVSSFAHFQHVDNVSGLTQFSSLIQSYFDQVGADIVVMIVKRDNFCGISFVDTPASYAFSIVDLSCIPRHTIAHEVC